MTTTEVEVPATPTAEMIVVDTVGLSANHRCDRCGAQAYVEAELTSKRLDLRFCVHHYRQHEAVLIRQASRIFDYRAFLEKQESLVRGR